MQNASTSSTPPAVSATPLSAPPFVGNAATDPRYREGRRAVRWIEKNCVYGQGDRFGQAVQLDPFQVHFLLLLFELKPDGSRRRRRALFEVPKGNGKTPLSAWVGAYELARRQSAIIPVAAASFKQADLLFGDLRDCVRESPTLPSIFEAFEDEIQVRNGSGSAYKVAAMAGTNDGQRPSCFLADEIHEWTGNKERVHLVIANGLSKRADSLVLNTTTPGWDTDTLAGRMHDYGLKVNAGEIEDDDFLFVWYGVDPAAYDLEDHTQLLAAVRAANPASDSFLNVNDVAARYYQVPRHEFIRYHLGQWTTSESHWLPPGAWLETELDLDAPPDHAEVVLGFDGSYNGDSTALVGVALGETPHVFVVEAWETPEGAHDYTVPILDVEESIRSACRRWQVRSIVADPYRWARSLEILAGEGLPVLEFPQSPARMTPATTRFYEAVVNGQLTHSADPRLARHISNCVLKVDSRGSRIVKDYKGSPRKIDLAVCAVMALDEAAGDLRGPSVWSLADAMAELDEEEPEEDA